MPTVLCCKECGIILYKWKTIPENVDWYLNLYFSLSGKCPKCGHKLPYESDLLTNVEITISPNLKKEVEA